MAPQPLMTSMAPFLRVLKAATAFYDLPDDASETAFVHVETFDSGYNDEDDPLPDYKALEALQLLVLLGEVDYDAWKQALASAWPDEAERLVELSAGRALRFGARLGFDHNVLDTEICPVDEWNDHLVKNQSGRAGSSSYQRVRQRLEDMYKQAEEDISREQAMRPRQELVIPVRIVFFEGPYIARIHKTIEIIESLSFEDSHQGWKPLFRVQEADPGMKEDGEITMQEFHALAHLTTCGVVVDSIDWNGFNIEDKHAGIFTKGLQALMKTPVRLTGPPQPRGSVKRVHVGKNLSHRTVSALFSAVRASQAVKSLGFNLGVVKRGRKPVSAADRSFAWKWVVYSLFSQSATHEISDVRLFVDDFNMDDVTAITEMVEARDPLAVLLGADKVDASDSIEFVTASKFQLPMAAKPISVKLSQQEVRVLRRTDSMLHVLLPGVGVAWVHHLDAFEQRTANMEGFGARGIKKLDFVWVNDQSKHAVLALLRLVGGGIQKVEFSAMKCTEPLDEWYADVGKACPLLDKVVIDGNYRQVNTSEAVMADAPTI